MQAIILVGGLGTRLQSVVKDVPKPMALVNKKPFLEHILRQLKAQGFQEIILSVCYKYEMIKSYFKDEFLGMKLIYSIEENPLGTGGAIKQALDFVSKGQIYVLNGDTFFDINFKELTLEQSKICLALKRMKNFERYGCVEIDCKGFVQAFREKEFRQEGLINGGVYLIDKGLFDGFPLENKFSFESFLQKSFKDLRASAKIFEDFFIDIGIPEDYELAKIKMQDL